MSYNFFIAKGCFFDICLYIIYKLKVLEKMIKRVLKKNHNKINHNFRRKDKHKMKLGRWIVLWIVVVLFWNLLFGSLKIEKSIFIEKWDTFQKFVEDLSFFKKTWLKIYLVLNAWDFNLSKVQEGIYKFDWKYSKKEFLDIIAKGPKHSFEKYVILEWWSVYDIDASLTKKWFIDTGEYIFFVNDLNIISKYKERYEFLADKSFDKNSLEWFLYPDTYYLDEGGNIVDQLVYLQLENFNNKVWSKYKEKISNFSKLPWYDILRLASIIEKEERSSKNRPTIAGIFLNRLNNWMRLGADITLCYGLHEPYETCTPTMIGSKIWDKSNIYNTRQNLWLPPQAISNPSVDSILAVLNYKKTPYFYYLHDMQGGIHYGKTLAEHNANKREYLN